MNGSSRHTDLNSEIGPDDVELVRLLEDDLKQTESVINGYDRTVTTIRGLAVTAVATLVGAGYASHAMPPTIIAIVIAIFFLIVDYYYSCLYSGAEGRIRVLVSLSNGHRRLRARPQRRPGDVDDFRGDLRTYSAAPLLPSDFPSIWPIHPLSRLKGYLCLYLGLIVAAGCSAVYLEEEARPAPVQVQVLCAAGPSPVVRATTLTVSSTSASVPCLPRPRPVPEPHPARPRRWVRTRARRPHRRR
jgi:hypothetical protein